MLNGDAKHWNEQGKLTYTTEYKDDKSRNTSSLGERTGKLLKEGMFAYDERNGLKKSLTIVQVGLKVRCPMSMATRELKKPMMKTA